MGTLLKPRFGKNGIRVLHVPEYGRDLPICRSNNAALEHEIEPPFLIPDCDPNKYTEKKTELYLS